MPIKHIISAFLLIFSLSGCSYLYDKFVYQINVTQGNYIEDENLSQIKIGMTQEQVIFILGSPMLIDQFDSSKWYYIRYIKPGGEKAQQVNATLTFKEKVKNSESCIRPISTIFSGGSSKIKEKIPLSAPIKYCPAAMTIVCGVASDSSVEIPIICMVPSGKSR